MATAKQPEPAKAARLLLEALESLSEEDRSFVMEHLVASGLMGGRGALAASYSFPYPVQFFGPKRIARGPEVRKEIRHWLRMSGAQVPGEQQMVPVRFPKEQYERFKAWCDEHAFSMAVVVRGLVERFLEEQGRRAS